MKYCIYCNKKCFGDFCGDDCRERCDKVVALAEKYKGVFLLGLLGPIVLTIPVDIIFPGYIHFLAAAVFITMSITLMALPFATKETAGLLGVKKSITAVRWVAFIIFIIGLIMLLYAIS